jgi:hypothetical protein
MDQDFATRVNNLERAPRCGAKTRADTPCQRPAMRGKKRCHLHGGLSPGAPRGSRTGNFKNGEWTDRSSFLAGGARSRCRYRSRWSVDRGASWLDLRPAELELVSRWYAPHLERRHEDAKAREADLLQLAQIASTYPNRQRFLTEFTLDPPTKLERHWSMKITWSCRRSIQQKAKSGNLYSS